MKKSIVFNQRSKDANVFLGYYYGMGIPGHVDINTDLAFKLLDDTAVHDQKLALYYKGVICLKTLNDERNARKYLEAAVQRGSEDAKSLLNSLDEPIKYVNKSKELLSSGDLSGALQAIVQAQNMSPYNLAVMRQTVELNGIILLGRAVTGKIQNSDKDLCYMVLDLIKRLRENAYETEGLSFIESNMYYCLGCIYHMENDIDTALRMLSASNVDDTPDTACEFFNIHIHYIDRFINELYIDASRLVQALNSRNWHTNGTHALAFYALSIIYVNGAPGIAQDINYAYNCIQQCNLLAPEVAAREIQKYSTDYYGRIVYNP